MVSVVGGRAACWVRWLSMSRVIVSCTGSGLSPSKERRDGESLEEEL